MSLFGNDPMTGLAFSMHENKGVFAVLLGSGISKAAAIPTGWEITLDLVRRVASAQGVESQLDWGKWYYEKTSKHPNYSTLLEEIASTPEERRAILHRYIEPSDDERLEGKKLPTQAHHAIAKLVQSGYVRLIITTNFDRLMENALREIGIEPTIVSSNDALLGAQPLIHTQCYLLKLHGDYKDARILNTDSELSVYSDEYNKLLDRAMDEHGLIVCGWSGEWDHALRAALLRTPNRRYPVYWAARGELGTGALDLTQHRGAKIMQIEDANKFFDLLHRKVEMLEQNRKQNPLSVDLVVHTTKRYLSKPEHRIQLDELLTIEVERLLERVDGVDFSLSAPWGKLEIRERIERYESISEPLAKAFGVIGRWGSSNEDLIVLEIVRGLYRHMGKVAGGNSGWLSLRSYPLILLFTAYGLGAVREGRFKVLNDFFTAELTVEHREPQRIVDILFLWNWTGGEQSVWQQLEGLERRKTPLSDHLFDVMNEWRTSFAGVPVDFDLLFDRFEVLGSLAHLSMYSEAQVETALSVPTERGLWMSVGRVGWKTASLRLFETELNSEKIKLMLLAAGFAHGSRRFLELFLDNLKRRASFMQW